MSEGKKGEGLSHGGGCEWGLQWKDVGVRVWFTDRGDGGDGVHKGEERVCNLVFLIDNTYKSNRYRLPLLVFVGVILTGMTFSVSFAYLEGEHVNNVLLALERFRGFFSKT